MLKQLFSKLYEYLIKYYFIFLSFRYKQYKFLFKDGRLRINDQIFQIGDINVRSMSSEQVAAVLRQSTMHGQVIKFVVARPVHVSGDVEILTQQDLLSPNLSKFNLSNINTNPNSQCFLIPTIEIMDKKINLQQRIQLELEQSSKKKVINEEDKKQQELDFEEISKFSVVSDSKKLNQKSETFVEERIEEKLEKPEILDEIKPALEISISRESFKENSQEVNSIVLNKDELNEEVYFLKLNPYSSIISNDCKIKPIINVTQTIDNNNILLNLKFINSYLRNFSIEVNIEKLDLSLDLKSSNFRQTSPVSNSNKFYFYLKDKFNDQSENLNDQNLDQFDEIIEINSQIIEKLLEESNIEQQNQFLNSLMVLETLSLKMKKNFDLKIYKLKEKWLNILLNDFSYLNDNDLENLTSLRNEKYEIEIIVNNIDKSNTKNLGISLEGTVDIDDNGVETCPHHYIRSIMKDGPVENSFPSKFQVGDELLEIDCVKLYAINYLDLLDILRNLNNGILILACARKTKKEYIEIQSSILNGKNSLF